MPDNYKLGFLLGQSFSKQAAENKDYEDLTDEESDQNDRLDEEDKLKEEEQDELKKPKKELATAAELLQKVFPNPGKYYLSRMDSSRHRWMRRLMRHGPGAKYPVNPVLLWGRT